MIPDPETRDLENGKKPVRIAILEGDVDVARRVQSLLKGIPEIEVVENHFQPHGNVHSRLPIKEKTGKIFFLDVNCIDWIESVGNYARIHCGTESYVIRRSISKLESMLDPKLFLRIHRCSIINVQKLREMWRHAGGDYKIILADGKELTLTSRYRRKLYALIGMPAKLLEENHLKAASNFS